MTRAAVALRALLALLVAAPAIGAEPPPAAPVPATARPDEPGETRITLRLADVPVSDALAAIADRFGLELVASGLDGRAVSVALEERTLDEALEAVLAGSDLAAVRSGRLLHVLPGDRVVSHAFPLAHATPSRVADLVRQAESAAQVIGDDASNLLYATGPASAVARIAAIVSRMDVLPSQVKIRARVLEVTLGTESALGIDWSALFQDGETSLGFSTNLYPGPGTTTTITLANDGADGSVDAVVRAIAARTRSRLLSSPEIVTANNQVAKILVGERVPYTKATTTTQTGNTLQEIEFVDVGVKLETTPQVAAEGAIGLDVSVEISEVLDKEVAGTPRIGTREAHARVFLASGDVLLFGGLMRTNRIAVRRGIPLLGALPVVGRAFRHEGTRDERTELVILVTPERVDAAAMAAARRRDEALRDEAESTAGED